MKRFKKLLSTLLVAVMLVGASPAVSAAEEENPYYPLSYEIVDGEVCITDCDFLYEGEIVIPESIDGYPVTRIGSYSFESCKYITSVYIPKTVNYISFGSDDEPADNPFEGCDSLTKIIVDEKNKTYDSRNNCNAIILSDYNSLIIGCKNTKIPESVTDIGAGAFLRCDGLTDIYIPKSVKSIAAKAFAFKDDSLHKVYYSGTVDDWSQISFGRYTSNPADGGTLFINNEEVTDVVFSEKISKINPYAFRGILSIKSVTIPDSIEEIGKEAFSECKNLSSITVSDKVKKIDTQAFYKTAYYNDESNWDEKVLYIGKHLIKAMENSYGEFDDCVSGKYSVKAGTKTIAGSAFMYCDKVTDVFLPDSVSYIGEYAFYGCKSLKSINIPSNIYKIEKRTFGYCNELTEIKLPNNVTSIGAFAFCGCKSLTNIDIPDSVNYIGNSSFSDTGYYNNLDNWENNILYIGHHLIDAKRDEQGYGLLEKDLIIKSGTRTIAYKALYSCNKLTSITIPESVTSICDYAFSGCKMTSITIPESVNNIFCGAFSYCSNLTSIKIPENVTSICDYAFSGCYSLTSVTIPESVTSIGESAFSGCNSLASITLPDNVTSIGEFAFSGCYSLTSITIPSSITSIGFGTFSGCRNLVSITIPDSVTSICCWAFDECDSLTDVYYTGTQEQWEEIRIGEDNEALTNATIHFNYAPAHTHTLSHITVSSTCKVAGMEYDICTDCGETFNAKTLQLAAHTWGEWAVIKEPTTNAEGKEKRVCSVCGEEETRAIAKINGIRDGETGIEIFYEDEFANGTELKVEQQFDGASFQLINTAYGQTNSVIYDIATYKDGIKVQPDGEITVRVPLPEGFNPEKVFVCFVDSTNGKVTTLPCEVKDGYVTFKTDHFSYYAIVEQTAKVNSVSVGDITLNYKKSATITPIIDADEGAEYTVTYTSSNPSVARVDENGKVYGAKKGSADITVTVTDPYGNSVSDTGKVNVKYSFGQWLIVIVLFGWIWY